MTLAAGTRLGPYEIVAPLGAGGMGEVYRATDRRLKRSVALKVLPEALAADRDRLSRFEQEARAASGLNHPNIVTIHEIGREDGAPWIAMELVEGHSVADLVALGPLPIRRILLVATQLAEGLAKAHAAGIVHRDLKPENVMVTSDGFVKILDFGLAKLIPLSGGVRSSAPTASPEMPRTEAGLVLGTVGYMSPEQTTGRPLDYRSDQFSFGSILYEMVIGRRPFPGTSAAEAMAAILRDEPRSVAVLRPETPAPLVWLIERCLAKEPADRYESTRDLARELATLRDRLSVSAEDRVAAGRLSARDTRSGRLAWAVAAIAATAAIALAVLHVREGSPQSFPARFVIAPPERATMDSDQSEVHNLAVSPEGSRVAFVASVAGQSRIWLRSLDSLVPTALVGTEGATSPFWSPDGSYLGFFAAGRLRTIAAAGGPPQSICAVAGRNSGAWGRTGTILFTQVFSAKDGLYGAPAAGGEPRLIVADSAELSGARWPRFLPDGRRFLFLAARVKDRTTWLFTGAVGSTDIRAVAPLRSRIEFFGPRDVLYVRDGVLVMRGFDRSKLRFTGEAVPIADRIPYFWPTGWAAFSASENGVFAYQAGAAEATLRWIDRRGQPTGELGPPADYSTLKLSPDGRRAAVERVDPATGLSDIWIADLGRGVMTRFTADPGSESSPVWSPDGSQIAYVSHGLAAPVLRRKRLDDSSSGEVLLRKGFPQPFDWSRDGKLIAYTSIGAGYSMWLLPADGGQRPYPFRKTPFDSGAPAFSPDGRWIAYLSDESTVVQVYVASSTGSGPKWQVSSGGDAALNRLRWRADGKELYYVAADHRIMAVPVKTDAAEFEMGPAVALFQLETQSTGGYDVSADGQRFLVSSGVGLGSQPITVVLHGPQTATAK